jgi:hypothetical protein
MKKKLREKMTASSGSTLTDIRTRRHFTTFDAIALSKNYDFFSKNGDDLDITQSIIVSIIPYVINFVPGSVAALRNRKFSDVMRMIMDSLLYLTDVPILFGILTDVNVLRNEIIVAIWLFLSFLIYFVILIQTFSRVLNPIATPIASARGTWILETPASKILFVNTIYHVVLMYLFWILFAQSIASYEVSRMHVVLVFQFATEIHRFITQSIQRKPLVIGNIVIAMTEVLTYALQLDKSILQVVLPIKMSFKLALEYFADGGGIPDFGALKLKLANANIVRAK